MRGMGGGALHSRILQRLSRPTQTAFCKTRHHGHIFSITHSEAHKSNCTPHDLDVWIKAIVAALLTLPRVIHTMPLPLDSRRTWFTPYATILTIVTTFLLGVRLVSRFRERALGLDDAFITAGWAFNMMVFGYALAGIYQYGYDRKKVVGTPALYEGEAKIAWELQIFFLWGMTFTKLSALMFYRRLVKESCSKQLIYTIWAAICALVVSTIVLFVLFITICTPMEAYWRQVYPTYKQFTCRSRHTLLIINETSTAVNVVTDIYSLVIPAVLITKLRLTKRQRMAVMLILGIGSITIFSSILRVWYLYYLTINPDSSWIGFRLTAASLTEMHVAIICACAPLLKATFRRFFGGQTQGAVNRCKHKSVMHQRRDNALFPSEGLSVSADRITSVSSFADASFTASIFHVGSAVASTDSLVVGKSHTPRLITIRGSNPPVNHS